MKPQRLTRAAARTPEETARLKAVRDRYQAEKPTPDQIAGDRDLLTMGEYLEARVILFELKKERERQHMTIAEMARRTGIDAAHLSRLEAGKADNPTLNVLQRMAAALHKSLSFALADSGDPARLSPA
jgi:DNA-binding Xre family transcriptional regulator